MINLLIILGIFCFSEIDATTRETTNYLWSHSNTVSKQQSISEITLYKEKFLEQEKQKRDIPYFRVLIHQEHPLMITKFPTIDGKEGVVCVSKLTELTDGFSVHFTRAFKSLIVSAGERIDMLDDIEMQTSLVLFPSTSNSMFKTNIWTAFGYPECDCEEGFMTRKEFEAATKNIFRKS